RNNYAKSCRSFRRSSRAGYDRAGSHRLPWDTPLEQIRGDRGKTAGQPSRLDVLLCDLAYRRHIHDDAAQVSMPQSDLNSLPAGPSADVHNAVIRTKIKAFRNNLSLRNAERIHELSELPQPRGVFVERPKNVLLACAQSLMPLLSSPSVLFDVTEN